MGKTEIDIKISYEEAGILGELIANELLNRIQNKALIDEKTIKLINRYPWIDFVRKKIVITDLPWLKDLIFVPEMGEMGYLALSLLQGLHYSIEVQQLIKKLWTETTEFSIKFQLAPRLLDFSDLDKSLEKQIYDWIRDNWSQWRSEAEKWFGGHDTILDRIETRLKDERFPPTKAWLYLCIASTSSDQKGFSELCKKYSESPLYFVKMVAKELLNEM